MDFDPPPGTLSQAADGAMRANFPAIMKETKIALYVESLPGAPDVGPQNDAVRSWSAAAVARVLSNPHAAAMGTTCLWYYNESENLFFRQQLFPEGHRATALVFRIPRPDSVVPGSHLTELLLFFRDFRGETTLDESLYYTGVTGDQLINMDSRDGTEADELKTELMTVPVAMLILVAFVQRVKLMLIPGLTLLVSLIVSYGLGYLCTFQIRVFSLAPTLMQAVVVAFNVDYNLFLLVRFLSTQSKGISHWANVRSLVTVTAFECVFVSGVLVALAFFSLGIIPVETLLAFGVTAGMTVLVCVTVNCTLTPALLVLLGEKLSSGCGEQPGAPALAEPLLRATAADPEEPLVATPRRTAALEDRVRQDRSWWLWIGRQIAGSPMLALAIIVAAGSFCYIHLGQAFSRTTIDPLELTPNWMSSIHTFRRFQTTFAPGQLSPFFLVLEHEGDSESPRMIAGAEGCFSPEGYAAMRWLIDELSLDPALVNDVPHTFLGPTFVPVNFTAQVVGLDRKDPKLQALCANPVSRLAGICELVFGFLDRQPQEITFDEAFLAVHLEIPENPLRPTDAGYSLWGKLLEQARNVQTAYMRLYETQISQDAGHRAMLTQIMFPSNPSGVSADHWIGRVRRVLEKFMAHEDYNGVFRAHLSHSRSCTLHDFNKIVQRSMPIMLVCLILAVGSIVAYVFKSIPIALLMGATIFYSVGVSLGFSFFVFQRGSFYWLFPSLPLFEDGGVCWAVLPLMTSIMAALAMDYDVFLLTTVAEYRRHGYTTEAAVLKALCTSGPTISAAALVMMVAFGGLMTTSVLCLNQFGICLFVSILVDGFVLATLFVPAALFVFGRYVWWPGDSALPGPTWREAGARTVDDCNPLEEEEEDGTATTTADSARSHITGVTTTEEETSSTFQASVHGDRRRVVCCGIGSCVLVLAFLGANGFFLRPIRVDFGGLHARSAALSFEEREIELDVGLDVVLNNPNLVDAVVSNATMDIWYHPGWDRSVASAKSFYVGDVLLNKPVELMANSKTSFTMNLVLDHKVLDGADMLTEMSLDCEPLAGPRRVALGLTLSVLRASVLEGLIELDFDGAVGANMTVPCPAPRH